MIDQIKQLSSIQKNYFTGKSLANFTLLNTNGVETTYGDIINKKTIIYFWSANNIRRYIWQFRTIKKLEEKYPELSKEEKHSIRVIAESLYTNTKSELDKSIELYKELDKAFVKK